MKDTEVAKYNAEVTKIDERFFELIDCIEMFRQKMINNFEIIHSENRKICQIIEKRLVTRTEMRINRG